MTPFLKQIAQKYFSCPDGFSDIVFVFPSRRAVIFFHKYIARIVKEKGICPVLMPPALTMDEFFVKLSDRRKADRITLMPELYESYCAACAKAEMKPDSLDNFVFWSDMILADFNDIDKYMVNAGDLLRNIAQYREMTDDFSYLSETQRKAMESFLGHFGGMGKQEKIGEFKKRFAQIWDLLYPIYVSFNESLRQKGLAYEGAVYRHVAEKISQQGGAQLIASAFPACKRVVFCGLNALNECEKKVMDSLKRLSLAEFCWDYASDMIKDPENRSSRFMRENIVRYGNDLELEACSTVPQVEVISVSSAIGQAKLLNVIMKDNPMVAKDERTAVMLADETLLLPVLSSIPEDVETVNVTMGYPLKSSSFYSLLDDICQMTQRTRKKDGKIQIYHKLAWSIVANNIFDSLADPMTRSKVAAMKKSRRYFIDSDSLRGTPLLDLIFTCPEMEIEALRTYLLSIVNFIGQSIASNEGLKAGMALEMDFAMECSKALNLLAEVKLDLSPTVWLHLFEGLLSSTSIPFSGEPLCGLQIMGPLETRALDFENLIILSANESVFPRKRVASSFVPPLLRMDFGLPTYEDQDAVWAYYFYRMIQRPAKVWMILDSRPEGLNSGEESRYIKQLKYHYRLPVVSRYANSSPEKVVTDIIVEKTPQIMEKLHSRALSATSLNNYIDCPLKFYYSFIEGLENEEQVSETLDAGMIGNVFHNTMEDLFKEHEGEKISAGVLNGMRADRKHIDARVRFHICDQLNCDDLRGREVVYARIIANNVVHVLGWDIELLKQSGQTHFVAGTEQTLRSKMGKFDFKGRLDRMDIFPNGNLRIVDYKTGKANDKKFALQLYIYDYLVHHPDKPEAVPNFSSLETYIYSTRSFDKGLPKAQDQSEETIKALSEQINAVLEELDNPAIPFRACEDLSTCEFCSFSKICNRC